MKAFLKKAWQTFSRPSVHISLGVLTLGGFIAGILFWGGFNTALEATNTEAFCVSCHADNVAPEYAGTIHDKNRSGVRATCPDCHVPHDWTAKISRKIQASKEVFAHVAGFIDTPEKFEDRRLTLAQHEWDRFSANKSLECRNCHDYDGMDFSKMSATARVQMKNAAERDQSCVDCHKGIAHHLPKNMDSSGGLVSELMQLANQTRYRDGETVYSVRYLPVYEDSALTKEAGLLNPASAVKILSENKDAVEVEIAGWRKDKGYGRVIQEDFGMNIAVASLLKESAQNDQIVSRYEEKVDELTGLPWQRVTATVWMPKDSLINDITPVWEKARSAYTTNCSVCHTQPAEAHFDANTWPGMFNGMLAFVNFDRDSEALVLKYLQKHSSDFSKDAH
ncbi:pentaheme c-type cytochrome TorC [Photobacterium aphoticum]|uniref:Cytochrome c-type protein n=1 Tax=Photobacterium aphoticum TaxID=754436 RepID=A0A0J1GSX2_9GAMM|nr:pentaheme c-type cytochrome TorC [Photobacterium aphoticum]KLV02818.1 nitrate reductase [Photobacterium aphoticum]PSU58148.1 pentaheme c-type cytochrome TorC [Photobacterium aphoticum]GHA36309.1 cytochrome c-type protein [Photobacterium aphoticum]